MRSLKDLYNKILFRLPGNMIDQDTMNVAKKKQSETVKEWRKRKRMFNGIGKTIF